MATFHVLYNHQAGGKEYQSRLDELKNFYEGDELIYTDVHEVDYPEFFSKIGNEASIIIAGGDGTLNRFINRTEGIAYTNSVYYYAAGSGNDFLRDIGGREDEAPVRINQYLKHLPRVTVNGQTYRYLNGIGYGIDGYCCEVGDKLKETTDKPVNYTSVAIKGLLFHYKPCNCKVTVDGNVYTFHKVWLAPTMNGRFYGGGMMATPKQDRLNPEHIQSVMVYYGRGPLPTLMLFPKIFKGEHVQSSMVEILTGKDIFVEFDSPRALQVDGETILNVSSYEVHAN